jgi:aspartate/methionine/tyrosine aminotransferase
MITKQTMNDNLLQAHYAVRGPIVTRAQQLEEQGRRIIYCNLGNPQAFDQRPLSYLRQTLSLLEYPELLQSSAALKLYPKDIIERARSILSRHPEGIGAYTQSIGIPFIREAVAEFIRKRDGILANKDRIILTDGASKGVQAVLLALLGSPNAGFMIPVPQYPLYSASITLFGGKQIRYYLDEENSWQLNEGILTQSITKAKSEGVEPVAIAVINPGNPTGAVLTYDNIRMIIGFARKHHLSIVADEVYQENIYDKSRKFFSFAKTMHDSKETEIPLFSLHSVSKGFLGECGHRGGYLELRNISDEVMSEFAKLQSINLCSNVPGQLATYLMVAPPTPGDESYETYINERNAILSSLKSKAEILAGGINQIEGMSLDVPQGALYAFVRFQLPAERDVDVASMTPNERFSYESKRDFDYCLALLEETGICVVPGSGFGQLPGTLHFRITFLPSQEEIEHLVIELKEFHESYVKAESVAS